MKKTSRIIAGLSVLGLTMSACGDGGVGEDSGDPLDANEAGVLFNELVQIGFGGLASGPAPMSVAAAVPIPETSSQCPGGGSVTVSGNVSDGTTSASFDITETISGCVISVDGIAFTVNGDPNIKITGDISFDDESFENFDFNMDMKGGFQYTADDGRAGRFAWPRSVNRMCRSRKRKAANIVRLIQG